MPLISVIWSAKYSDTIFYKRLKDKEHLLHGITALIRNLILAVQKISHYRRKQTFEFKRRKLDKYYRKRSQVSITIQRDCIKSYEIYTLRR